MVAAGLIACHSASEGAAPDGPPPTSCNGHAELCDRAYDKVAFPGTHDAYSNLAEKFIAADQSFPLAKQLEDGVRVLHLEAITNLPNHDDAFLCHGLCGLGNKLLVDDLTDVNTFVQAHPNEVVTLLLESSDLPTATIAAAFTKSGLVPSLHAHDLGAPWPTLGKLIQHRDHVVVFYVNVTKTDEAKYPWLLDRWSFTWETPWNNVKVDDFGRCNADRGTMGNDIYVVDTYMEDISVETAEHAGLVNANPFLLERLLYCQKATMTFPNFVMVNYYEVGDVFHDVDVLNGFAPLPDNPGVAPPARYDGDAGGD